MTPTYEHVLEDAAGVQTARVGEADFSLTHVCGCGEVAVGEDCWSVRRAAVAAYERASVRYSVWCVQGVENFFSVGCV